MKKLRICLFLIFVFCIINIANVYSASATANLAVNKETIKPGDVITVTLNASCEEGLSAVITTIEYNKDILELQNSKTSSGWQIWSDKVANKFNILSNSGDKVYNLDVLELVFKAKADIEDTTTEIIAKETTISSIKNVKHSIGDIKANVNIENVEDTPTEDTPTEDTPTEDTPTEDIPTEDTPTEDTPTEDSPAEDTPTEDTPTEDTPAEDKKDPTVSEDTIPDTGYKKYLFIFIAIVIIASVAYIQSKAE